MVKAGSFFGIEHKHWEIQVEYWDDWVNYFTFSLNINRKCDHAGFRLTIEIFGRFLEVSIYDSRHWDYENSRWCN